MIQRTDLRWLARRDYSITELRRKLRLKDFTDEDINVFIAKATQAGWINEVRYVENYIYARRNKGYGPIRIQTELRAKGVTEESIAELLDIADNTWFAAVSRVWQKYSKGKMPKDLQTRAKQTRFLQYRGFTQEQIEQVMNNDTHTTTAHSISK